MRQDMSRPPSSKEHSIKVPRLYKVAVQVLKAYKRGEGSVKTLVFHARKKHPNVKAILALVLTAVQNEAAIGNALTQVGVTTNEQRLDVDMATILTTELLLGKGQLPGESRPLVTIRGYAKQLKSALDGQNVAQRPNKLPRYVRVNRLKAPSLERLIQQLKKGTEDTPAFHEVTYDMDAVSGSQFLDLVKALKEGEFLRDLHIQSLLVFAPGTEFHSHPLYKDGYLLLQDKASCFPVECLDVPAGAVALDGCSAPGMKTTQLTAAVYSDGKTSGKVTAVERDSKRCVTLRKMLRGAGAFEGGRQVQVVNEDFLKVLPEDHADVEYIVLDPSCSGSGMAQNEGEQDLSKERLQKLATLQSKLIQHAMTFPGVKRISYSTCSIREEENEEVVQSALDSNFGMGFEVIDCLPRWERRGQGSYDFARRCVRAEASEDLCNGFFVAVFQKKDRNVMNGKRVREEVKSEDCDMKK